MYYVCVYIYIYMQSAFIKNHQLNKTRNKIIIKRLITLIFIKFVIILKSINEIS